MTRTGPVVPVEDLVARIPDGSVLAVPRESCPVAMAATCALIRRGVRDLHLVTVPTGGLQADLLIGAGCVATIETAGVDLGEHGPAPRFNRAVREGAVIIRDSTCPAVHAALQAAEKGLPFMPIRGIVGSDLLVHRDDWRIIDNPFAEDDPIVVLSALRPDVALFHAPLGDREGNVWVGRDRELVTMAHAARTTLVTVERVRDRSLLESDETAAGTLPALYVEALAEAPGGARPLGLAGHYLADDEHLRAYGEAARSDEGFADYLARHVLARAAAAE